MGTPTGHLRRVADPIAENIALLSLVVTKKTVSLPTIVHLWPPNTTATVGFPRKDGLPVCRLPLPFFTPLSYFYRKKEGVKNKQIQLILLLLNCEELLSKIFLLCSFFNVPFGKEWLEIAKLLV